MSPPLHRDLKPTNVLLDEDDRPVLMDLGSMNRAHIEVNSSREAMAVQVGAPWGGAPLPQALHPFTPLCLSAGLGCPALHHLLPSPGALHGAQPVRHRRAHGYLGKGPAPSPVPMLFGVGLP